MHKIAMLGTGLIGRFYTMSLQNFRGKDEIKIVCAGQAGKGEKIRRGIWHSPLDR